MNRLITNSALITLLLAPLLSLLGSCSDSVTDPSLPEFPESNVSYTKHVEPLFQARCAGCHAGNAPAGQLNLSTPSYSNLMNHVPRLVNPGNGDQSLLIQRLDGRVQPQMPFNRQPLTAAQVRGIRTWINEGALNN
jgi:mono/diheme cytochrome c family protein